MGSHPQPRPADDASALAADGISVGLPEGWTGRIVLGAAGLPVLHAASFPVEANDTDEGEIAKEAIGINGMYLNVRDLGPGGDGAQLPVRLDASDFAASGHLRDATLVVSSGGERFRVMAVSGGEGDPAPRYLDELNATLSSLQLSAYQPAPVQPASGDPVDAFGLHINVPPGWQGGIARGEIHAGDDALDLTITEFSAPDAAAFVTGRMPIRVGPAEFVQPPGGTGYETGRSFLNAGREFQLWVRAPGPEPPGAELERVNALLASFWAEPGDFYPGTVDPATFEAADGWHTGTSGPADIQPDGQATTSWASTIPYRDGGFQFPPHDTLEALPADGIIVLVTLEQHGSLENDPSSRPPRLSDFLDGGFEGISQENATRHITANEGHYSAGMWVLFGREHPTREQLDRAQAELDRLRLPQWPDWTMLTSAAR